jgi:hypothetical protein
LEIGPGKIPNCVNCEKIKDTGKSFGILWWLYPKLCKQLKN